MFADVEQGHLWVSARVTIIPFTKTLFYGFAFLVMHDYDHYVTGVIGALKEKSLPIKLPQVVRPA